MEEIDRFQVPTVRAEMQPLVREGRAGPRCPREPPPHPGSAGGAGCGDGECRCWRGGGAEVGPARRVRYVTAVPSLRHPRRAPGPCPAAAAVSSRGAHGHGYSPGPSVLPLSSSSTPGISPVGSSGSSRPREGRGRAAVPPCLPPWKRSGGREHPGLAGARGGCFPLPRPGGSSGREG